MSGGTNNDYWPGFVDALTNVVIAMVFVIVVLAIALSFSAQLLAQRMAAKIAQQEIQLGLARAAVQGKPAETEKPATPPPAAPPPVDAQAPVRQRIAVAGNEAALAASAPSPRVKPAERYLQLDFASGAVTVDAPAAKQFVTALAPLRERLDASPNARFSVVAAGPEITLSENQRAAFIRAMTVRNLLLEQGIAAERITTRIDMNLNPGAPLVAVRVEETR